MTSVHAREALRLLERLGYAHNDLVAPVRCDCPAQLRRPAASKPRHGQPRHSTNLTP